MTSLCHDATRCHSRDQSSTGHRNRSLVSRGSKSLARDAEPSSSQLASVFNHVADLRRNEIAGLAPSAIRKLLTGLDEATEVALPSFHASMEITDAPTVACNIRNVLGAHYRTMVDENAQASQRRAAWEAVHEIFRHIDRVLEESPSAPQSAVGAIDNRGRPTNSETAPVAPTDESGESTEAASHSRIAPSAQTEISKGAVMGAANTTANGTANGTTNGTVTETAKGVTTVAPQPRPKTLTLHRALPTKGKLGIDAGRDSKGNCRVFKTTTNNCLFEVGDVITKFNGQCMPLRREWARLFATRPPMSVVTIRREVPPVMEAKTDKTTTAPSEGNRGEGRHETETNDSKTAMDQSLSNGKNREGCSKTAMEVEDDFLGTARDESLPMQEKSREGGSETRMENLGISVTHFHLRSVSGDPSKKGLDDHGTEEEFLETGTKEPPSNEKGTEEFPQEIDNDMM